MQKFCSIMYYSYYALFGLRRDRYALSALHKQEEGGILS